MCHLLGRQRLLLGLLLIYSPRVRMEVLESRRLKESVQRGVF